MTDAGEGALEAADQAEAPRPAPAWQGPYGPIAPGARVTYAWATPVAQVLMYFISVVPALIVTTLVIIPILLLGHTEITAGAELPPEIELPMLVTAVVVQFPVWVLFIILWVRAFERRSLASAGLRGPYPLRKYAVGLAVGIGCGLVLAALSPLVAPETVIETDVMDVGRVFEPDWLITIGLVVLFFLGQSACEEIACRGWMLSAVAARRGIAAGVVVNTGVFASLHVHLFRDDAIEIGALLVAAMVVVTFAGWLGLRGLIGSLIVSAIVLFFVPWDLTFSDMTIGVVSVAAIACVGLFLSLWAVNQSSIAGCCGIHGGFNSTIVVIGLFAAAATNPDASPSQALLDTIKEATAQGDASVGGAVLQLVVFAVLAGLVWWWMRRRRV